MCRMRFVEISLSVVLVLSMLSSASAACRQQERSNWLKDKHHCINLFVKAYGPDKQPKSGLWTLDDIAVNTCFEKLDFDYPVFAKGDDDCLDQAARELDDKFNGFSQLCLHRHDMSKCEELLDKTKKIDNIRNGKGATLLMVAAQEGDFKAMNMLLQKGASAKTLDHNGFNLLHYALSPKTAYFSGDENVEETIKIIVKKILELGVHPQELNLQGENAVIVALYNKVPASVIELLVMNGANVNLGVARPLGNGTSDVTFPNILLAAMENLSDDIVFALLKGDVDWNNETYTVLTHPVAKLIQNDRVRVIEKILANKYDVKNEILFLRAQKNVYLSPLCWSIVWEKMEIFKLLVKAKSDVNEKNSSVVKAFDITNGEWETPLMMATDIGNLEMVKILLKAGAKPNLTSGNKIPLGSAIQNGRVEIVKTLVGAHANVNASLTDGTLMLEWAEQQQLVHCVTNDENCNDYKEIVSILQKAGARKPFRGDFVNYCRNEKITESMVLDAIKEGADVNEVDEDGWTPLHALAGNSKDVGPLNVLIKRGAFVNAATKEGYTPLMVAAFHNPNPAILKILIAAGADLDATTPSSNWDALFYAVSNNSADVVSFLLKTKLGELGNKDKNTLVCVAVTRKVPNPKVLIALFKAGFKAEPEESWWDHPLHLAIKNNVDSEVIKVLLQGKAVVDDRTMSLARDLPMDDGDQRKYRNQIIDLLTKAKKKR